MCYHWLWSRNHYLFKILEGQSYVPVNPVSQDGRGWQAPLEPTQFNPTPAPAGSAMTACSRMWPVRFFNVSQDRDCAAFLSNLFLCLGLVFSRSRALHFPLLGFMRSFLVHFSSLSRPFWMAAQPPSLSNPPPSFVSSTNTWKVHDVSASRSLMKMISSIYPFGTPLVADQQPYWPSSSASFESTSLPFS